MKSSAVVRIATLVRVLLSSHSMRPVRDCAFTLKQESNKFHYERFCNERFLKYGEDTVDTGIADANRTGNSYVSS